jgi:protein-disulfide isomerase
VKENKSKSRKAAEDEAKAQIAAAQTRANRNMWTAIAAVVAVGLGLAVWMTSDRGAKNGEALAQKSGGGDIAVADLMAPGDLPENVLGPADAKVTIVEYASMTCPACANFHKTVYPELKKKYVETGKVRFVFREFPIDPRAAAGSMLARCAGGDKYFPMVDVLFQRQEQWAFVKASPIAELQAIAKQIGMSEERFNTCINDKKLLDSLQAIRDKASDKFGVSSTPTFFVNGKKLVGGQDLAAFDKLIEPLLK